MLCNHIIKVCLVFAGGEKKMLKQIDSLKKLIVVYEDISTLFGSVMATTVEKMVVDICLLQLIRH